MSSRVIGFARALAALGLLAAVALASQAGYRWG